MSTISSPTSSRSPDHPNSAGMNTLTPISSGHAPGKIILFGEHAVVYGRAAIAAPLSQVQAYVEIFPASSCQVEALDVAQEILVAEAADTDPFAAIVRFVCAELAQPLPAWRIVVQSDIPIAAGLGSGAAIAAAMARAIAAGFGRKLAVPRLSELVFEVEKLHHGTPSGIDNTVVVYEQPVWFVRGQPPQLFSTGDVLHVLVADTGIASPTRATVADVRNAWAQNPVHYEDLFDQIGTLVLAARTAMLAGNVVMLGRLMNDNHSLLVSLGVSCPELDQLCLAALSAGALGAKLSGGGRGGNMVALFPSEEIAHGKTALIAAGATRVIYTQIHPSPQRAKA